MNLAYIIHFGITTPRSGSTKLKTGVTLGDDGLRFVLSGPSESMTTTEWDIVRCLGCKLGLGLRR